jgi:hypothetical protein
MMDLYVRMALATRQPLAELMTWEPKALATATLVLEEQEKAAKDAAKGS